MINLPPPAYSESDPNPQAGQVPSRVTPENLVNNTMRQLVVCGFNDKELSTFVRSIASRTNQIMTDPKNHIKLVEPNFYDEHPLLKTWLETYLIKLLPNQSFENFAKASGLFNAYSKAIHAKPGDRDGAILDFFQVYFQLYGSDIGVTSIARIGFNESLVFVYPSRLDLEVSGYMDNLNIECISPELDARLAEDRIIKYLQLYALLGSNYVQLGKGCHYASGTNEYESMKTLYPSDSRNQSRGYIELLFENGKEDAAETFLFNICWDHYIQELKETLEENKRHRRVLMTQPQAPSFATTAEKEKNFNFASNS